MVHLEELVDCLYVVTGEKQVWVGVSGGDNSLEVLLDVLKDRVDVVDLGLLVTLDTDHPTEAFVYVEYLVKLEVQKDSRQLFDKDEQEYFSVLICWVDLDELVLRKLRNFQKCFCRHVLNARVLLMHELAELVYHSLQEGPVRLQKVRKLARYIHDVSRYLCLIPFAFRFFAKVQKLFDHLNDKALLFLSVEATRN